MAACARALARRVLPTPVGPWKMMSSLRWRKPRLKRSVTRARSMVMPAFQSKRSMVVISSRLARSMRSCWFLASRRSISSLRQSSRKASGWSL